MSYPKEKKELIYWAHLLNQKGFVSARSGNISYKVDKDKLLITAHNCYLGQLEDKDILLVDLKGNILEAEGELTSEKKMHLDIQNKFKEIKVVLHAHPAYAIGFFHYFQNLDIHSFEARFYLSSLEVIPQVTPTVIDTKPILEALESCNLVVLKDHGVVAIGEDFKSAFSLIELLEEQAKVGLLIKNLAPQEEKKQDKKKISLPKYKLLSKEHLEKLTQLVNNDPEAQELGKTYDLTCTLAIKNQDTGEIVCFYYEKGKIVKINANENADFLIIGKEDILKKIFNRELDPFVASTQGKVKTKGDFSKLSRWYPVLVRTFKLWEQAPVE